MYEYQFINNVISSIWWASINVLLPLKFFNFPIFRRFDKVICTDEFINKDNLYKFVTSLWRPNIRSLPVEELSSDKVLQTWWGKDDVAIPVEKSVKLLNHDNSYYWGYWGEWVTRVTGVTRKTKFTRVTWATLLIWLNGDLNDWETLRPPIVAFHIY